MWKSNDIDEDITSKFKVGWLKYWSASERLYNKRAWTLEDKIYEIIIRPSLFYKFECWIIKISLITKYNRNENEKIMSLN